LEDLFEKQVVKISQAPVLEVFIDGASSGNPGPAAVGAVIYKDKKTLCNISKFIGKATNNVAEYTALICALEYLLNIKAKRIIINTDSQLLANQLKKKYKVKNQALKELHLKALGLFSYFDEVKINNIARELNREADRLAVKAIKEQAKVAARHISMAGGKSELQRET